MPTTKQRRAAAQRKLQRQLERRAEAVRRRRQRAVVLTAIVAVVAVVVAVWIIVAGKDDGKGSSADASASASAGTPPECTYTPRQADGVNVRDVGLPQTPPPKEGKVTLDVVTDQGNMTFGLDRSLAPCAVQSMEYLASQGFFNNSPCHRLVDQDTFGVLQCGDPSGTGQGGPAYQMPQEPPSGDHPYTKGVIAMANSGQPDSTGSQFFIMFKDTDLPPDYSVVGTVTAGLDIVENVAAAGNDGSMEPSPGGGKPNLPITIQSMTVAG